MAFLLLRTARGLLQEGNTQQGPPQPAYAQQPVQQPANRRDARRQARRQRRQGNVQGQVPMGDSDAPQPAGYGYPTQGMGAPNCSSPGPGMPPPNTYGYQQPPPNAPNYPYPQQSPNAPSYSSPGPGIPRPNTYGYQQRPPNAPNYPHPQQRPEDPRYRYPQGSNALQYGCPPQGTPLDHGVPAHGGNPPSYDPPAGPRPTRQ
ncbi:hypothetical protein CALCODRAFT_508604 [Calocera cornea HHB12733]|uniref:Uncharacterized protein n=1 Tax=Calocera cornea HHB12733 TaxID=1353952 RepID=A0A165G8U4_9BASI|nr:hypothetical protein CALCODRAFT_508604 [Calocera cornea HHB12733]